VELGEVVGRGFRSVVYAYGADEVAKVPNHDVPAEWLDEELRLADIAARAGAPVPSRRRIIDIDGRPALLLERIDGPSLWDVLLQRPERSRHIGVELAHAQIALTGPAASVVLPSQRDRVVSKIHTAARQHGDDLLGAIDRLPADTGPLVLCHGDLHPRNILVSARGEVLVDWFDASRGSIEGEIARTLVMLRDASELATTWSAVLDSATAELAVAYRDEVLALSGRDADALGPWELAQSVARLAEGFGLHRLDAIRSELAAAG